MNYFFHFFYFRPTIRVIKREADTYQPEYKSSVNNNESLGPMKKKARKSDSTCK